MPKFENGTALSSVFPDSALKDSVNISLKILDLLKLKFVKLFTFFGTFRTIGRILITKPLPIFIFCKTTIKWRKLQLGAPFSFASKKFKSF